MSTNYANHTRAAWRFFLVHQASEDCIPTEQALRVLWDRRTDYLVDRLRLDAAPRIAKRYGVSVEAALKTLLTGGSMLQQRLPTREEYKYAPHWAAMSARDSNTWARERDMQRLCYLSAGVNPAGNCAPAAVADAKANLHRDYEAFCRNTVAARKQPRFPQPPGSFRFMFQDMPRFWRVKPLTYPKGFDASPAERSNMARAKTIIVAERLAGGEADLDRLVPPGKNPEDKHWYRDMNRALVVEFVEKQLVHHAANVLGLAPCVVLRRAYDGLIDPATIQPTYGQLMLDTLDIQDHQDKPLE